MSQVAANVVRIEAEALAALAERLSGPMARDFARALDLLSSCRGRVVVTGMGKSGIVARKVAATLNSTGTPSLFLHPAEAVHGDLGMLVPGDLVLALSASGETEEILRLLATIKRLGIPLISLTCDRLFDVSGSPNHDRRKPTPVRRAKKERGASSTLAQAADVALDCSVAQEACALGLAPTASTSTMMALGDALAVALADRRGFKEEDFANLHPGGKLGKRLARVSQLMHTGRHVPSVRSDTPMAEVIDEMSRKGLGVTTVLRGRKLVGIISDGDLRRLLERHSRQKINGKSVLALTAADCMTQHPATISADEFATTALRMMEERKITSLAVVEQDGTLQGILHLHDLWGTEMV